MQQFSLSQTVPDATLDPTMGVWDGNNFVFTVDQRLPVWWNTLQASWKYDASAPQRTRDLVGATLGKFFRLYEEPYFPFRSLTQRANELGLVDMTGVSGQQFLKANNVGFVLFRESVPTADNSDQ